MAPLREEQGPSVSGISRLPDTTSNSNDSDWVAESPKFTKVIHRDFAPSINPDTSTCWTKAYSNFSECVQSCNEWLQQHNCQVVTCETIPLTTPVGESILPDTWPHSLYLRGLRIWVLVPDNFSEIIEEEEQEDDTTKAKSEKKLKTKLKSSGRILLGFRDFTPSVEGKSMFTDEYEDINALLERVNFYLLDRSTPAKVLSLQTIDAPTAGVYELEFDTEESRVSTSQHGYTRFCRFLRLFFLVELNVTSTQNSTTREHGYVRVAGDVKSYNNQLSNKEQDHEPPLLQIKDFVPSDNKTVTQLLNEACAWSCSSDDISFLNLQIISLRAGKESTNVSWTLDSPGHLPNKFKTFIRLIYVTSEQPPIQEAKSPTISINSPSIREQTLIKDSNRNIKDAVQAYDDPGLVAAPGMIEDREYANNSNNSSQTQIDINRSSVHLLAVKCIIPEVSNSGACGRTSYTEHTSDMVSRVNDWVKASDSKIVDIHTHLVYNPKTNSDIDKGDWVRYSSRGRWMTVLQVVTYGGIRAPKDSSLTAAGNAESSCTIL